MTARQQIKRHEGLRLMPYADTVGKMTIGYGHNLSDDGITDKVASELFEDDYATARIDVLVLVRSLKSNLSLGLAREAVLINMAFNLGRARLAKFERMLAAVEARDFGKAADEMLDSKWARQVGDRATELAEQMRTGRWHRG